MFSAFVLLILIILFLSIIYYLIGNMGVFKKVGTFVLNTKNIFKDKEKK